MGIIRAGIGAVGSTMKDQWLDAIEPDNMTATTIMTRGVMVSHKGTQRTVPTVVTDGSLIQVGENQMMLLVDGKKIVDYSAEPGYYKVSNENAPSMFNGDFMGTLSDAFNRFKFGGSTPYTQQVYYINTQEIRDIPFGTTNAINYFDEFYNAELYLRAHGYYSIRIVNPIKFYEEMVSKSADHMDIDNLRKICLAEFLTAFQTAIGKMSVDGIRISHIASKSSELAKVMADILDDEWEDRRGMKIEAVGIASISYDDQSKELINIRNQGAMLGDANIRTGYVQGAAARGVEAAGSNNSGAMGGFLGLNMGMDAAGNLINAAGQVNNAAQNQQQTAPAQPVATMPQPAQQGDTWVCSKCNYTNHGGKFCINCGGPRATANICPNCKFENQPGAKFCANCGANLT